MADSIADSTIDSPKDEPDTEKNACTGRILISSYDGKALVNCYKVLSSYMFKTKKDEPKFALFGVDGSSFWGENTTVLGWYDHEEKIKDEIKDIMHAINQGNPSYELKYAVAVERRWGKFKISGK